MVVIVEVMVPAFAVVVVGLAVLTMCVVEKYSSVTVQITEVGYWAGLWTRVP